MSLVDDYRHRKNSGSLDNAPINSSRQIAVILFDNYSPRACHVDPVLYQMPDLIEIELGGVVGRLWRHGRYARVQVSRLPPLAIAR